MAINTFTTGTTYRETIQGFRNLIADKTGTPSDQNPWSSRLILKYLTEYRSRVLAENIRKKGRMLSRQNEQTIPCIPMELVDTHECPCAPPSGCHFLRTRYPVPKPVIDYTSITSIDGTENYAFVEWNKFKYKVTSRMRSRALAPFYTIKNSGKGNHIYILTDNEEYLDMMFITVTATFYDPLELAYYPDCEGQIDLCAPPADQPFIMDPDLLSVAYERMAQALLPLRASAGIDILNNDQDETSGAQPPLK